MVILLLLVSWVSCEDASVAVQDLLSLALSPAALLGFPGPRPPGTHLNRTVTHGDLSHALGTMLFHRSKMNEYLCHNYLADEILSDLRPLESRSGEAAVAAEVTQGGGVPRNQLLADPGSSGYKDWLEKSPGLEDMYGHADPKGSDQEGFETGDVTGYATVHGGKEGHNYGGGGGWPGGGSGGWSSEGSGGIGWNDGGGGWNGGGGGGGWSGGGSGWTGSGSQGWHDNSGSGVTDWGWDEQETGKGLALKDLFDLALTALAFLAFKVFALQLIMACFAKTPHMNVVMSVTSPPAGETRTKRETNHLNELAYRVLTSIDTMMELQVPEGEGSCLQYTLCDNNKYSRALNNNNRLWLPVWSLGMSWAAGLWDSGLSRIDTIRASVLGLGNANCAAIYPQCRKQTRNF